MQNEYQKIKGRADQNRQFSQEDKLTNCPLSLSFETIIIIILKNYNNNNDNINISSGQISYSKHTCQAGGR